MNCVKVFRIWTLIGFRTLTLNTSPGISMQVICELMYFTPDYEKSVAHLTMISFRNVSQIHLSFSVAMCRILTMASCVVHFIANREQSLIT